MSRHFAKAAIVVAVAAIATSVAASVVTASNKHSSTLKAGGTYRVGWESSFGFTDNFDPTGEYLGSAWGIYTNLLIRTLVGYTLSLREKEFVESARALGAGNIRILATEILPNLVGPLIVYTTLLIPTNILFEAALSYLGLGVPSSEASWGAILTDASQLYDVAWWLMVFPGGFLIITTLAFNLLGDGLRDAFDVRSDR